MATSHLTLPSERESLARVVHDLRSPLAVIRGLCFVLQREEPRAERRRHLQLIDGEVERLARGLERLLAPPDAAEGSVCLVRLAEDAAERYQAVASDRVVAVRVTASRASVPAHGDPDELGRVLDNLLGNAVRHSPRGGTVRLQVRSRSGAATLTVRDQGPGVAPGDAHRVFAAGERGRAPRGPGQGLGLAIARDIAERHGGRLELLPVGSGASFRLSLPLAAAVGDGPRTAA